MKLTNQAPFCVFALALALAKASLHRRLLKSDPR